MPNLTNHFYEMTKTKKTTHYIETGTYLGFGVKEVLNNYDSIHSIELSEKWYEYNKMQFEQYPNVHIHLGDSKKKLPELLNTFNFPVTVYLDAHYSGELTAHGDEEVPLLFELEALKKRKYDDIIIIDDCRLLGKIGKCGAGPNHGIYPDMTYNWSDITEEKIENLVKRNYIIIKNDMHKYLDGPSDRFILVKNNL